MRVLTADEAVELIVSGNHPEVESGTVAMDGTLVEMLRTGEIEAALLADGRLAFRRP